MNTESEPLDEGHILKELKKEFESSFEWLIPGIIHNFSNPLSGIVSRSELLEEKTKKTSERIANNDFKEDDEIRQVCKTINRDAGLIVREGDKLFGLFNDVTEKFQRLNDTALKKINLSELIRAEIDFFEFHPDVKHTITKSLTLDRGIPEVMGAKADYSFCLSAIFRHSIYLMKDSEPKELVVSADYDDSYICVTIKDTGEPIAGKGEAVEDLDSLGSCIHNPDEEKGLFCALSLLKKYGVLFRITYESGFNVLLIRIPYWESEAGNYGCSNGQAETV